MKGSCVVALAVCAVSICLCIPAGAQVSIPWYNSCASTLNVWGTNPEGSALQLYSYNTGYGTGSVNLPMAGEWLVEVVGLTGPFPSSNDVSTLTVDGTVRFAVTNFVGSALVTNWFRVSGSSFSFRWDFVSPVQSWMAHFNVAAGKAWLIPQITSFVQNAQTTSVSWTCQTGGVYAVQWSSNSLPSSFGGSSPEISGAAGWNMTTNLPSLNAPMGVYRVRLRMP